MSIDEMGDVIYLCSYPGYEFSIHTDPRGAIYLQAGYAEAETTTGRPERQLTRRWFLNPEMTRSEIVQTAFKCIATSMEHRTREWFRYQRQPVFGPHLDVDALLKICQEGRFAHRQETTAK